MENDKEIVNAQKKLIEAMSPTETPKQRFFGYLAQVGANIMGSDRGTFMEAAGDALGQALKDYKFDRKEDQERFVKQAELMVDLEWKKRNNTMQAMQFKSQVFGIKMSDALQDHEDRVKLAETNQNIENMKYQTGIQSLVAQGDMAGKLFQNNIDRTKTLMAFGQQTFNNDMQAREFAQRALEFEENKRIALYKLAPSSVKEFEFYDYLKSTNPDKAKDYLKTITTATKNNQSPDVTARSFGQEQIKAIIDKGGSIDAHIEVLGEDVWNQVKTKDNALDVVKLYSLYYWDIAKTQLGMSQAGGGNVPDLTYTSDGQLVSAQSN